MLSYVADLLFPKSSLTGESGVWVSTQEREAIVASLRPLLLHEMYLRKQGLGSIDAIVAATTFSASPLLRALIHQYKYKKIQSLHVELSPLLIRSVPGYLIPPSPYSYPALCPVPLHWVRHFSRGFNQAELLCSDLVKHFGWEGKNLLLRTTWTGQQVHRNRAERLMRLVNCFQIQNTHESPVPPWVVLIDDVCTTGATLDECAKVLKKFGVKHVSGLVVAYG